MLGLLVYPSSALTDACQPRAQCYTPARGFLNAPPWGDEPFVVSDLFVLKKDNHSARGLLQSQPLGWELRLAVGVIWRA